ncbi:MAG TPA: ribosome small subunit-dependent GTPase A [Gammaproteobacteria bacterium]|nr:ribosome small subunit-dependent GTPase A [Gammaproteobacteria bacterium]
MNLNPLEQIGWSEFFSNQLSGQAAKKFIVARIAGQHRKHLEVWTAEEARTLSVAKCAPPEPLVIGDWILLNPSTLRLEKLLERYSLLKRQAAGKQQSVQLIGANVDTLFILSSCNQDFNLGRLERYIALALNTDVEPVLILTKADLSASHKDYVIQAQTLYDPMKIIALDARDQNVAQRLSPWLQPGKTIAVLGSSGVGKSSLASSLGADPQRVAAVRAGDQKGRHTTTWRSMHRLNGGALLIDNPGIRELRLVECERGVERLFSDLLEFAQCRYADCRHLQEPSCGVLAAVESGQLSERRWLSYQKLLAEQAGCESQSESFH